MGSDEESPGRAKAATSWGPLPDMFFFQCCDWDRSKAKEPRDPLLDETRARENRANISATSSGVITPSGNKIEPVLVSGNVIPSQIPSPGSGGPTQIRPTVDSLVDSEVDKLTPSMIPRPGGSKDSP